VNRIEGLRIKEKARGPWAKVPFFFPLSNQNREGGGRGHGRPAGAPAGGSSRGGGRGAGQNGEGTRGFFPRAHLGLEGTVEAARRRAEGGGGANGGGAVVLGEEARGCSISVRCGEVVVVPALNRRRRLVWGGEKIFPTRPPASSGFFSKSGRILAATGDATARAGTGQLVQGS
jgi:hypothetical protein